MEFAVDDTQSLAALLKGIPNLRYKLHDEALHMFYTTSAITKTRRGDEAFATALLAHLPRITHPNYRDLAAYSKPTNRVFFGDGEEISEEIINQLIDIHDALAYRHQWKANDVLLIDNTRYLHGRTMTQAPCERIIVSRFGWLKSPPSF